MPPPTPAAAKTAARAAAKAAAGASKPKLPPRPSLNPSSTTVPPKWPKWKIMVVTGCFAAVTFVGSIYGAGLKTKQEWKAERQKVREASVQEKMTILEQRRAQLLRQKHDLDRKLQKLHARIKERKEGEARKDAVSSTTPGKA